MAVQAIAVQGAAVAPGAAHMTRWEARLAPVEARRHPHLPGRTANRDILVVLVPPAQLEEAVDLRFPRSSLAIFRICEQELLTSF